jgi:hypothetical protein
MHRNDLNIKNKVHINTKSYINSWNKLALHFRISHTKSILINVYVYCKNGEKFYNLLCETIFEASFPSCILYICYLFTPGKQPYFEISEMTTHRTTHGNPRPRSLMNFRLR